MLSQALVDGATSSDLTLGSVTYSNDNGTTFSYTPTADAEGYDSSVTDVQFSLNGTFVASNGVNYPSAEILFYMGLK